MRNTRGQFQRGGDRGQRTRDGMLFFVDLLVDDLHAHGREFVKILRRDEPAAYAATITRLLPKEIVLTSMTSPEEIEINPELLMRRILALAKYNEGLIDVVPAPAKLLADDPNAGG